MNHTIRTLVIISALAVGGTAFTGCAAYGTGKSTGEYIDDMGITGKVKAAFVKDPVVKALDVGVDTYKGTVQLNGFVDSEEQRARAEQIAASIPGVVGVQNKLTVKGQAASMNTPPPAAPAR